MKLIRFYTLVVLLFLSYQGMEAQNASLCVPAEIAVREGDTTVTCEPGAPMWIRFRTGFVNTPYGFAVTEADGTILRVSISDKVSFTGLPGGQLRVYAFSYIGLVLAEEGGNIFNDELASICSALSPNYIEVLNIVPEGGTVQSSNGRSTEYICTDDDLADILTFETSEADEPIYGYLITDENNQLLNISNDGSVDFTNAPAGTCRVWGIAYTGNLIVQNGENITETDLAEGCYDVSDNFVSVIRTQPDGATITVNGATADIQTCDFPEATNVIVTLDNGNDQTFSYGYIISDEAETTYTVVEGTIINLSELPMGSSRVRGISYAGTLAADSGTYPDFANTATGCYDLSDNFITLTRTFVEGGQVALSDGSTEARPCGIDDLPDSFSFQTNSTAQESYAWVLTEDNNAIKGIYTDNVVLIDEFEDEDNFRVYGLSYSGEILPVLGQKIEETVPADGCFQISENFVTITRIRPDGGALTLGNGNTDFTECISPGNEDGLVLDLRNTGDSGFNYRYLLTDTNNVVLQLLEGTQIATADLPIGVTKIWGANFEGTLPVQVGDQLTFDGPVAGCYDLSDNALTISRIFVDGGQVALTDGSTAVDACGIDAIPDVFSFQTSSTAEEAYAWVLTRNNNRIIAVYTENEISIDAFENISGFRVRGLSYRGTLLPVTNERATEAVFSNACYELSENFVAITRLLPNGGTVSLGTDNEDFTECVTPGNETGITFDLENTGAVDHPYTYLVTDTNNTVLRLIEGSALTTGELAIGVNRIWGVSFAGNLPIEPGDQLTFDGPLSDCYDLSDNFLTVTRIFIDGGEIALADGTTEVSPCGIDDIPDVFSFQTTSTAEEAYAWVLTRNNGRILAVYTESEISIDAFQNLDRFRVRGLSYRGSLLPVIGESLNEAVFSNSCFELSDNFVRITRLRPEGGTVSLADGSVSFTGCDSPDSFGQTILDLTNNGNSDFTYTFLLTDTENNILQIINQVAIPLSELPSGTSRIWGVNYEGTLSVQIGDNPLSTVPVDGCYDLSDNFIEVERIIVDGGDLSIQNGGSEALTCGNDDIPDVFTFSSTTTVTDQPYVLVVTDENDRVFSTVNGGIIDFDLFAPRTYRIYGLSYTGNLNIPFGSILTEIAPSDGCYDLSNTFATIRQEEVNGGQLQFTGGGTEKFTCPGDGMPDVLTYLNNGFSSDSYVYLITDANNVILATSTQASFDFDEAPEGICRIWGLAYSGTLNAPVGAQADTLLFSDECYSLSENFLSVIRQTPVAGSINLVDGGDTVFTCPGDGQADLLEFTSSSDYPGEYLYLITHENNRVIDVSFTGTYDFDFAEPGNCRVYGVAFTGNWIIQAGSLITAGPLSDDCWTITDNYITVVRETPTAGLLSFTDGTNTKYTCPGDNRADLLEFETISSYPGSYIYLITDEENQLLTTTTEPSFDFDEADLGTCRIWGLAYTGELLLQAGDEISFANLSDDCFDLTNNFLSVIRDTPDAGTISTPAGNNLTLCVGDAFADVVQLQVEDASNSQYAYLITDESGFLIGVIEDPEFDFNNAIGGICRIYGLAYTGEVIAIPGDNINDLPLSSDCFSVSENFITLNRLRVDGSTIFTTSGNSDVEYICSGDGVADPITFQNGNNDQQAGVGYQYLLTNADNIIIGQVNGNTIDVEDSPFDTLHIWGVAYTGAPTLPIGMDITTAMLSDSCYDISDNFIALINGLPEGGTVSTADGDTNIRVCIGGESGIVDFTTSSNSLVGYIYVITTPDLAILGTADGSTIDFNTYDVGNYLVHGLSYTGALTFAAGDTLTQVVLASSCYELSANAIQVERTPPLDGGTVTSAFGNPLYVCLDDGMGDIGAFETTSTDPGYRYVITDTLNNIVVPNIQGNVVDFDQADAGFFRIYGVSFTGNFIAIFGTNILEDPLSDRCSAVSANYISLINENFAGGTVSTEDGETEIILVAGDGIADVIAFDSTGTSGLDYTYVITDENNAILGIPSGDTQDFEGAGEGTCRVWGLSYSGEILAQVGDTLTQVALTSGCFELSDNFITVQREGPPSPYAIQVPFNTVSKRLALQLYPNPVSRSLNIHLKALFEDLNLEGEVSIEIFDLSGRRLITKLENMVDKESIFEMDVQELPMGMYVLRATNGNSSAQQRFFKQ